MAPSSTGAPCTAACIVLLCTCYRVTVLRVWPPSWPSRSKCSVFDVAHRPDAGNSGTQRQVCARPGKLPAAQFCQLCGIACSALLLCSASQREAEQVVSSAAMPVVRLRCVYVLQIVLSCVKYCEPCVADGSYDADGLVRGCSVLRGWLQ